MALLNPGDLITCENGHLIAEVIEPIELGERHYDQKIGHWRVDKPIPFTKPDTRCPCGALYWSRVCQGFHIEGRGWVPPFLEDKAV